jgi:hypothetical protein
MRTTQRFRACAIGLLGGLLGSTSVVFAADCSALKQLKLADTTIATAEPVTSGSLEGPGIDKPLHDLPVFCRVTGVLRPSSDSDIHFEVWLPETGWNQRFLGVGNGGFAGSIGYESLAGNLRRGFATAGSDAGHKGGAEDASWSLNHPEKVNDFGWRAVHLTALRAKDVIKAYYSAPVQKAYFDSCSDGGREALMEAQRFPEDYDGILAGAPANAWTRMLSSGISVAQGTLGPENYIPAAKLPAIQRASLAACDASDGVKDGFLSDPAKCHFNPNVLMCKGADSPDCLTALQVQSLKRYYAGGVNDQGKSLFPGYVMGDEEGWRDWVVGKGPGTGSGAQYVKGYFRYMVTGNPDWNILTADVDASFHEATTKTAAALDATNSDLSRFRARGSKLILYHGWNDPAISPWNSIAYYQTVQDVMGAKQADGFVRLYMVPGMEHCAGGPGPSAFGQLGIATTGGPKYGVFDALVDWREKGAAPQTVIATKYDSDKKVTMTRPLCPYPAVAKYKGTGDTNEAANFACSKP